MRRKQQYFRRTRNGLWLSRGKWEPSYLDGRDGQGIEYQHYGCDATGTLVYAGVTRHEHSNRAIARQIHRVWARWRHEYDNIFDGKGRDYPARYSPKVVTLVLLPVDRSQPAQSFTV